MLVVCRHSSTSMCLPREDKWCLVSRIEVSCPAVAHHNAAGLQGHTCRLLQCHNRMLRPCIHFKLHKLTSSAGRTMS